MLARTIAIVALIAVSAPGEGCKALLAKARHKDAAEADGSGTTTRTTSAAGAASQPTNSATGPMSGMPVPGAAPRPTNTAPAGDALLTLGTGEWWSYAPDGTRFSVLLPQRPQESTREVRLGGVAIPARQAAASRVGAIYTFIFFDLPPAVKPDGRVTLDLVRDDAVRGLQGATLKGERQIALGKNAGREFQAESTAPFPMLLTGHAYLVGRRVYEQLITLPSSVSEGSYVDKYFGSLDCGADGAGMPMSDLPPAQPAAPDASAKAAPKKKR
jgi:hypothetical protein